VSASPVVPPRVKPGRVVVANATTAERLERAKVGSLQPSDLYTAAEFMSQCAAHTSSSSKFCVSRTCSLLESADIAGGHPPKHSTRAKRTSSFMRAQIGTMKVGPWAANHVYTAPPFLGFSLADNV
jgi:hypothetical protein